MAEETNSPEVTETQAESTQTTETQTTETETTETAQAKPEEVIQEVYNTEPEPEPETEPTEAEAELLAGKFKTPEDLEKSYLELQSTFSKKLGAFEGAPEEYKIPEGASDIAGVLAEWGKENQLSQEGLETLYKGYEELQQQKIQESYDREFKALGKDAQSRLDNVYSFLEGQLGEQAEALSSFLATSKSIEAVETLMQKMGAQGSPVDVQPSQMSKEQIKEMRFAVNDNGDRLMSIDPEYRAKVLKLEQSLV